MSPTDPEHQSDPEQDPWLAHGYLVAGVLLYGGLGYLADRWLGTSFLVVVGILFGATLGIYMTFKRFGGYPTKHDKQSHGKETE
jgi:F0F1-type ATP synthase assembly protein I